MLLAGKAGNRGKKEETGEGVIVIFFIREKGRCREIGISCLRNRKYTGMKFELHADEISIP